MRTKTTINIQFRTKRTEITNQNIEKTFETLENKRKINEENVKRITEELEHGKLEDCNFVVNQKTTRENQKYRLLDGNHRYEALKRFLAAHPTYKVEILLTIYENLS